MKNTKSVESKFLINRPLAKKIVATVVLVVALVAVFMAFKSVMDRQEEMVTIIKISKDVKAGDVLTIGSGTTKPNITKEQITRSTYQQLNSYVDSNGKKLEPVILAKDVQKVDGMIASYFLAEGTWLRGYMLTNENLILNPYIENMPDTHEIYTLSFDSDEVYTRLMIPGAMIRVRGVSNISAEFVDEVRSYIQQKESKLDLGLELPQDGQSVVRMYMAKSASTMTNGVNNATAVAEIIFDKIRVVDMLNSNGESLFALYSKLIELPIDQRIEYLKTDISEKNDNSLWKRLTPEKLVLIVSHEDASLLAEFEQLGGMEFKYTLLKPGLNGDDELYSQFLDVTDTLQNLINNYSTTTR